MGENHWNLSSGFLNRKLNSVDLAERYCGESFARSASKIEMPAKVVGSAGC